MSVLRVAALARGGPAGAAAAGAAARIGAAAAAAARIGREATAHAESVDRYNKVRAAGGTFVSNPAYDASLTFSGLVVVDGVRQGFFRCALCGMVGKAGRRNHMSFAQRHKERAHPAAAGR